MPVLSDILKNAAKYEAILNAHIDESCVLDLPHLRSFSHLVNEALRSVPSNKVKYHDVLRELERVRGCLSPILQAKIAERGNGRLGNMPNIKIDTLYQKITARRAA